MLCGKCEQIFGNKENLFTQRVLRPYRESRNMTFEYDEWLYYFITSLSWKTLYNDSLDRDEFIGNGFTNGQFDSLVKAELQMRKYLTEESRACLNIDNHLIFLDNSLDVKDSSKIEYSTYCNATLGYVFGNQNTGALYVFHILAGVLVITVIKKHSTDKYKNTYVKKGKGKIKESQSIKSLVMESEVLDHIPRQLENARQNMSEHQQQKLIAKIEKDPEGFLRSSSSINYREG